MSYFETTKIKNVAGTQINPATEEKQDSLIAAYNGNGLAINNEIDQTAFNINAAPFSATTSISNDFILENIEFNFSATESRTITVTTVDGTQLYLGTSTEQSIILDGEKKGYNTGDNITVDVTQTAGACTMDCILRVSQGAPTLSGNPVIAAGTNNIGDVNILNVANSAINPATEEKQDALSTKVGEVQDTPTNHTILGRVKDVSDLLFAMWTFGLKVLNASNVVINPATSEIQTDGTQKTQIVAATTAISPTYPMPIGNMDGIPIAAGWYSGITGLQKFGHNDTLGTALVTLWVENIIYVYPPSASTMTISSSSASDILTSGTGAWTVTIEGLDTNYAPISETLNMNGTAGVTTSNSYLRVFRARVRSAGTAGWNVGNIYVGTGTITAGKPANVYTLIDPTHNQTLQCIYTVPSGKTAYITHFFITVGSGKEAEFELLVRPFGEVFQVKQEIHLYQNAFATSFTVPIVATEKSDIEIRGQVMNLPAGQASSSFDIVLVDN